MLAKENIGKGYGDSFDTVQKLATHSRYCQDVKALREGQQTPTGINWNLTETGGKRRVTLP